MILGMKLFPIVIETTLPWHFRLYRSIYADILVPSPLYKEIIFAPEVRLAYLLAGSISG